ncbi:MAG TPA: small basic protein [Planctomycetota bacterium]|nr:small basic protein [Planctomycetota bacterium]HRR82492.1 small basic protein [Planctomycetota bacterium]HRT97729.1 small basic protein [Planctomycetota bacterium]
MSLHKSLASKSALKRHRNVLTRAERVKRLMDDEAWQEGQSIFSLPKVKIRRVKAGGKVKKAEKAAAAEGAAEGAAAPAADTKKAK